MNDLTNENSQDQTKSRTDRQSTQS